MARRVYTLLLWLALPLIVLRLVWRARSEPRYLHHWGERFGLTRPRCRGPAIVVHAVSVGEVRAAQPLLTMLREQYPQYDVVLTCTTPTGRATALEVCASTALVVYLPYDFPWALRRFLEATRARLLIVMETEVWPNLMAVCAQRGLTAVLANARLSARSSARYGRVAALSAPAFASFARVAAQTEADARRLEACGARQVQVTGNLKFEVEPPPALLKQGAAWRAALGGRQVVLAASTRDGEEELVLAACAPLLADGVLLVLVPRHPPRFAAVAALARARGLVTHLRSEGTAERGTQVWIGDSMGEMPAYYALADCAYVGGSLLPFGGQNLIEAAACGCPVVVGPHTYNFADAAEAAIATGAALRVADADALASTVGELLGDDERRRAMASAALAFAAAHRGAGRRTLALIEPLLPRSP
ncbi:MAG: lipid IV(A) 3-deoxy-D-manno-octulosonic acid transferase [Burkholderiales bacterium]|nr:lipid IV(A) 3-deoxy-D-manno-octulosonic acid transferase [Burkholderiales bacterium]